MKQGKNRGQFLDDDKVLPVLAIKHWDDTVHPGYFGKMIETKDGFIEVYFEQQDTVLVFKTCEAALKWVKPAYLEYAQEDV